MYFSEKLELLHSNQSTLRLLKKKKQTQHRKNLSSFEKAKNGSKFSLKEKLYSGFEFGMNLTNNILILDSDTEESNSAVKRAKSKSVVQKKIERQTKAKMLLELEEKKDVEIEVTNQLMNNYLIKSDQNDGIVKDDLKKQMKAITDRINRKSMVF